MTLSVKENKALYNHYQCLSEKVQVLVVTATDYTKLYMI